MLKGKSVHSAIDSLSIPLAFMFRAIFSWISCVPSKLKSIKFQLASFKTFITLVNETTETINPDNQPKSN